MKKIGIIGRGFVGSAVEFGFSAQTGCDAIVKVYDKNPKLSQNTLEETLNESDFVFLSYFFAWAQRPSLSIFSVTCYFSFSKSIVRTPCWL